MAENERDTLPLTEIGNPVPAQGAFHPDADVFPVRFDHLEKDIGRYRHVAVDQNLALLVDDADVHRLGVQVDAAEILVLFGVKYHGASDLPPGNRTTFNERILRLICRR
jgi:hypothetical protein